MASLTAVWGLPLAGSLTAPSAAHAVTPPDADVAAITSGLTQFCTFTQGLAGDGKFGQPLPMLNLIPGSDAGFGFSDLCQSSVGAQVSSVNPIKCSDLSNLANSSLALTNSRTAKLAISNVTCGNATSGSTNGVPDQFTLDLQVDRTVTTGLNLSGSGNQAPIAVTS